MLVPILIFWSFMAVSVSVIARFKGRDVVYWFAYGLVGWPAALFHIAGAEKIEAAGGGEAASGTCRECGNFLVSEMALCRSCQYDLSADGIAE